MSGTITFLQRARRQISVDLRNRVAEELKAAFPEAVAVVVWDVLSGFSTNHDRKLILAVEVTSRSPRQTEETRAHIIKIGALHEIGDDIAGWDSCLADQARLHRIFVPVARLPLASSGDRGAVLYEDASQWYNLMASGDQVATLGFAAIQAVCADSPSMVSVNRLIRQLYRDLQKSLYLSSVESPAGAIRFYRERLRLPQEQATSELPAWTSGPLVGLRRDVDWLLSAAVHPSGRLTPDYIDPHDAVVGLLAAETIPATQVGPSHGDVHGENVVVGISDGEIESPLLIDYGNMTRCNVVAWDFVKLEMETKVRVLAELFQNPRVIEQMWQSVTDEHAAALVESWRRKQSTSDAIRLKQIVFAAEFERRLIALSREFDDDPAARRRTGVPGSTELDRALSIIVGIRRQASLILGKGRADRWRAEYDFALAVYGLNTFKFDDAAYPVYQRTFALVSAGMAAARLPAVTSAFASDVPPSGSQDALSYHLPLRDAYKQWSANTGAIATVSSLDAVADRFAYSAAFRRDYALILAETGRLKQALELLDSLDPEHRRSRVIDLCDARLDIELLARIGRLSKERADKAWQACGVPFEQLSDHAVVQWYNEAYAAYCHAFEISGHYYPGGNAAVTALLSRRPEEAQRIATNVAASCKELLADALRPDEPYWIFVTEADMALILGDPHKAADFYREGLQLLSIDQSGMAQTTYDQVCRLFQALGRDNTQPAPEVFTSARHIHLNPGPLGDCGGQFSESRSNADVQSHAG